MNNLYLNEDLRENYLKSSKPVKKDEWSDFVKSMEESANYFWEGESMEFDWKPDRKIRIESNEGCFLELDFNTDVLKVSGNLSYSEAAVKFIEVLSGYTLHKKIVD